MVPSPLYRHAIVLVMACGTAAALGADIAATASNNTIKLVTGEVNLATLPDAKNPIGRDALVLGRRVVIQLDGPIDADRRAAILAAGVVLGDYLPDFAYVADMKNARLDALTVLDFVAHVVPYQSVWKIDPELTTRVFETTLRRDIAAQGIVQSHVYLFPAASITDTTIEINKIPGLTIAQTELEDDRFLIQVSGPQTAIRQLADIDAVQWVEPAPELTFRNSSTRWIIQSNVNNDFPIYDQGIHGEGQLIAVMDGRVNPNHCSFTDPEGDPFGNNHRKIQAYNSSTGSDFHGTHVAGTAMGDNGADNDTRGIAYGARLIFDTTPSFSFSSMNARLNTHYNQGAAIHTNSWGNDGTTAYDGLARAIDSFSFNNDDNLVLFAVTNGSSLRNPENAKNCLAVGASLDANSQGSHCSGGSGPTSDGRRKPEIYAPGCGTRSASSSSPCGTTSLTGTSMASPAIAGAAALARQYYMDGFYPTGIAQVEDEFTPSGPLVKATLMNSSVNMTGISGFPSNREGWGRVLLDNALFFDGDSRMNVVYDVRNSSSGALQTGDVWETTVTVETFGQPFKATLVWHDAPASTNASFTPVNNLDIEVDVPLLGTMKGNVFSGGNSTTGGSADTINNVEMILLTNAPVGEYTIRVKGTAVNNGPQGYALVITGDVSESIGGCSSADLAEPFGQLNLQDVFAYLALFNSNDPSADLAAPFGQFNLQDVFAYLTDFNNGCP
ncbi:MAG: S8 family serine peptidase [Phycisphaerales bacterium]|nr:S8 family serine peptidase [Phycisphaerales bacterium]